MIERVKGITSGRDASADACAISIAGGRVSACPGLVDFVNIDFDCPLPPDAYYMKKNVLDPTVPAAMALVEANAARIAGRGFEMLKHDFSTYDIIGMFDMYPEMKGPADAESLRQYRANRTRADGCISASSRPQKP